ncbi:hypothetical protein P3S68_024367 [Capsicum galapagoense]
MFHYSPFWLNSLCFCYALQELEEPLILIHEKKISSINTVVRTLELALKVYAIKAPGIGENRRDNLQDLTILT